MILASKLENNNYDYLIDQMIILDKDDSLKLFINFVITLDDSYYIHRRLEEVLKNHFPKYMDYYEKLKLLI